MTAPGKANTSWLRPKPTHASESGGLPLLTLATEVRPRHRFEARLGDRFVADRAYTVRALPHASECFFDGYEEATVAFMQKDLKLRFRIVIGLVNNIALVPRQS